MEHKLTQSGFGKIVLVLALCLIIAGCYYLFGYRNTHSPAAVAHKAAVAKQVAKVNKAKQLQTKLEAALQQAVTATPPDGNVDIAVYDNATGAVAHYTNVPSGSGNSCHHGQHLNYPYWKHCFGTTSRTASAVHDL